MKDLTPIAVASRSFSRSPVLREELLDRYDNVLFNDEGLQLKADGLVKFLRGRQKAVIALECIDENILSSLPELKIISKYGVGIDKIDLGALEQRGVMLGWTGGVNRRSVAELVIAFAISLMRSLYAINEKVQMGQWKQEIGRQLSGCKVGIIGCGHVGKEVAMLFRAFGCHVCAYDIRDYAEFYKEYDVEAVGLEELLVRSDIVTLHVPLDDSTHNILNAEKLAMMKRGAYLINTARGSLVDEDVLKVMLMDGRLGGAAFDVFSTEPPEDLEMIQMQNFIATPHIGGSTAEAILAMGRAAIHGLDSAREVGEIREIVRRGLKGNQ